MKTMQPVAAVYVHMPHHNNVQGDEGQAC